MSEYISTTEAAELLGVNRVTVFNMIRDGRIEGAIKVGRNYIIPNNFREAFVSEIAEKIIPVLKKHKVKKAGIFGSYSIGRNRKKSDLDLLIDYGKSGQTLFDFIGLQQELEGLLGVKVDLGIYDSVHPRLKDRIFNQQIPIL